MTFYEYESTNEPRVEKLETYYKEQGSLTVIEIENLKMPVKRVFWISTDIPGVVRGGHAHKECWQLISPIVHSIEIEYINTKLRKVQILEVGYSMLIPPWNWILLKFPMAKSGVVVFASHSYDAQDYIYEKPKLASISS